MRSLTRVIAQPRINSITVSSCILSDTGEKDVCLSHIKSSCLPLQRTTSPCSNGNVSLILPERLFSPTRDIATILTGTGRENPRTMSCSLLSRLSKERPREKYRGARPLMTFIRLPFLPSENLSKHSTAGLSIKQTFKDLKSAGHCLTFSACLRKDRYRVQFPYF